MFFLKRGPSEGTFLRVIRKGTAGSMARGGAMKANDLREYGKAIESIRVDPYRFCRMLSSI